MLKIINHIHVSCTRERRWVVVDVSQFHIRRRLGRINNKLNCVSDQQTYRANCGSTFWLDLIWTYKSFLRAKFCLVSRLSPLMKITINNSCVYHTHKMWSTRTRWLCFSLSPASVSLWLWLIMRASSWVVNVCHDSTQFGSNRTENRDSHKALQKSKVKYVHVESELRKENLRELIVSVFFNTHPIWPRELERRRK